MRVRPATSRPRARPGPGWAWFAWRRGQRPAADAWSGPAAFSTSRPRATTPRTASEGALPYPGPGLSRRPTGADGRARAGRLPRPAAPLRRGEDLGGTRGLRPAPGASGVRVRLKIGTDATPRARATSRPRRDVRRLDGRGLRSPGGRPMLRPAPRRRRRRRLPECDRRAGCSSTADERLGARRQHRAGRELPPRRENSYLMKKAAAERRLRRRALPRLDEDEEAVRRERPLPRRVPPDSSGDTSRSATRRSGTATSSTCTWTTASRGNRVPDARDRREQRFRGVDRRGGYPTPYALSIYGGRTCSSEGNAGPEAPALPAAQEPAVDFRRIANRGPYDRRALADTRFATSATASPGPAADPRQVANPPPTVSGTRQCRLQWAGCGGGVVRCFVLCALAAVLVAGPVHAGAPPEKDNVAPQAPEVGRRDRSPPPTRSRWRGMPRTTTRTSGSAVRAVYRRRPLVATVTGTAYKLTGLRCARAFRFEVDVVVRGETARHAPASRPRRSSARPRPRLLRRAEAVTGTARTSRGRILAAKYDGTTLTLYVNGLRSAIAW